MLPYGNLNHIKKGAVRRCSGLPPPPGNRLRMRCRKQPDRFVDRQRRPPVGLRETIVKSYVSICFLFFLVVKKFTKQNDSRRRRWLRTTPDDITIAGKMRAFVARMGGILRRAIRRAYRRALDWLDDF